jgi:hypothetical protein
MTALLRDWGVDERIHLRLRFQAPLCDQRIVMGYWGCTPSADDYVW